MVGLDGFRVRDDLQKIRPGGDFVYELLGHTQPALYVDVGAAAGHTVAKAKQHAPKTRVIAFEPFPGNAPIFEKTTQHMEGVTLIRKAVANDREQRDFFVPHVVAAGGSGPWSSMTGYSSVGFLVPDNNALDKSKVIRVDTCHLDDYVAERVGLLKIDVQGHEFGVLEGGKRLIDEFGIDIIFSEFTGDHKVLELLHAKDYDIFDTGYITFTPNHPVEALLDRPEIIPLSTGAKAFSGYLGTSILRDVSGYCRFFAPGNFQTDLFAVKRSMTDDVLRAIATLPRK